MPSASPFDPLDRLEPGEDRFPIREKDPCGPATITFWAHQRRNWAIKLYGSKPVGDAKRLLDAELAQCAEADEKALNWSERQRGGEAPAEEQRATYSGFRLSEEQVAQARRLKLQQDLERNLAEADYAAHELLQIDGPAVTTEQAELAEQIHALAVGARQARAA
ncbi:hypothetical protein [Croceibacterium aestuarii]|uniref:hypothetical protein n=1 Tax=Croceibacterium aestuarii TaxID=3064139 RepID=UPI00272DDE50|nr:hypothetical protein [Croceibacterium sp. D39]